MTARPALAALASGLLVAGSAQAATWTVTETGPAVGPAQPVSVARDGRILATGARCDGSACETVLATRPPGGAFAIAGRVAGAVGASVPLRGGGALLVTAPVDRRGLTAVDVTRAGRVRRTSALEQRHADDPVAASDRRGTAAVAWLTSTAPRQLRVRVRRRDGGAFGPARTLATVARVGDFGGVAVAVGPRGEVAVLWVSDGALRVRVLRAGARRDSGVLRAGRSDRLARIAASFSASGTLTAIWSSADGGEEQNRTAIVRVAALRPGARGFARSHKIGAGGALETLAAAHGVPVAVASTGRTALVAWTSRSLRVRVATVHADGSVTAVRGIEANAVLAAAAAAPGGRALLAVTRDPLGLEPSARAALVAPGPRLGVTEPAGPAGSWATSAVLDDAGAAAVVGWSAGDPAGPPRWGIAERGAP
jgi:hypothetical protein